MPMRLPVGRGKQQRALVLVCITGAVARVSLGPLMVTELSGAAAASVIRDCYAHNA